MGDSVMTAAIMIGSTLITAAILFLTKVIRGYFSKHEKHHTLIEIELKSINVGMQSINDKFASIGKDYKNGYETERERLIRVHKFIED